MKNGNTSSATAPPPPPPPPLPTIFGTKIHRNTDPFRYLGCTGCPADSHVTIWLTVSKDRPIVITLLKCFSFSCFLFFFSSLRFNRLWKQERCPECGSVYKMEYIGAEASHDDHHHDDHSGRIDDGRKQTLFSHLSQIPEKTPSYPRGIDHSIFPRKDRYIRI